ncbi:MAG: type II toxin-antitoxin system HicA family toxin [Steroidobacter sp.]
MAKQREVLERILKGEADANVAFEELRSLLLHLGFDERVRGSHHVFRRSGIEDRINLQRDGKHAKAYQVRQVRGTILRNRLGSELK